MKLLKIFVAAILALAAALTGGCSDDDGIDNRDLDYGYVQFKLYKQASYDAVSRAQKPQLDYLYEAAKVQVSLGCNGTTVTQTLTLSASDKESAEFGLRSEKLRLLTGQYQIITFSLYNANDELIYNGMPLDDRLVVEAGGLQVHDLTVDVEPRGKVRFTIRKDLSDFTETPVTRAADRQYTFDEIAFISLTVKQGETNEQTTFKMLPTKFSIHFDEDDDTFGYQTSSLECDTLLSLKAGSYKMMRYETYDKNKLLLETNKRPKNLDFVIEDNKTTETKVGVTLYEADEYIRDYYALYEIWKALDGPNWYFSGENYPEGTNWDFNKDPDLWGIQPGVEVHSNGRVAKITLSDFGFRGHLPAAIGRAHAGDRALSGFAQRRQPARIRSLDRARQEPERAEAHPHGAQQGVPPPDPHADADLRADRPCAQGAQPDHSGHLALRGELYRGRDHRPQNRTSEAYPPL
ncbi:MAG: DUF4458 domain-containing protein [Alistipes finegoldii]